MMYKNYPRRTLKQNLIRLLALLPVLAILAGLSLSAAAYTDVYAESASGWARDIIINAVWDGYVPDEIQNDYTRNITRSEFCLIAMRYIWYGTGMDTEEFLAYNGVISDPNAFTDTQHPDIAAAYALGITHGTDTGLFSPDGYITREQAATMILRLCGLLGMDTDYRPHAGYSDSGDISDWAADGINFCYANGIMTGTNVSPLTFSPKAVYTREQAITTFSKINNPVPPEPIPPEPVSTSTFAAPGVAQSAIDANYTSFRTISDSNGTWKLYGDYNDFLAVFYVGGTAEFVYISGTSYIDDEAYYDIYTDSNNYDMIYAVSMGKLPGNDTHTTELMIFELTNAFRALHGLTALVWSDHLSDIARAHSWDMFERDYVSHYTPEDIDPGDRMTAAGYDWGAYAENIIAGFGGAVKAVDGWINSSGHRVNLLSTSCTELGVGWHEGSGSSYKTYGTQLFGFPWPA